MYGNWVESLPWCHNLRYKNQSTAMLLFKVSVNRYELGLSNELLFIIIAQEAAKLWTLKGGGPKKLPVVGLLTW